MRGPWVLGTFSVIKRRLWAGLAVPRQTSDVSSGTGSPRPLGANGSCPEVLRPRILRKHRCFLVLEGLETFGNIKTFYKKTLFFLHSIYLFLERG